jgi:glycosyltransferase involved in cell wall biosynthesis
MNDEESAGAPTLSVVIPAYNVESYVETAVASVLNQTFLDLEVIVVDDGSNDATPTVLQSLAKRRRDRRLKIMTQPNRGLSSARNMGITHARGEFIGLLDGDDAWRPQKAEKQIAVMRARPDIGLSYSNSEYMTREGIATGSFLISTKNAPAAHDLVRKNHLCNGSTPIIRRSCFERAGLFREELKSCEDYEMWARIVYISGMRTHLVAEALTLYRRRNDSLSFNIDHFLAYADLAIDYIRATMPDIPNRTILAGHAELYRVAAWRACMAGKQSQAWSVLRRSIAMFPIQLAVDWRVLATATALLLGRRLGVRAVTAGKAVLRV